MTDAVIIERIPIPTSQDDPAWRDYVAAVDLYNVIEAEPTGRHDDDLDPVEALPSLQDQTHRQAELTVARLESRIVGVGIASWTTDVPTNVTWVGGGVHPDFRNRGIGTALMEHVEAESLAAGRGIIQSGAPHRASEEGEQLTAPTGFGKVPLNDPGVRFFRKHGYGLEQVHRVSHLYLPFDPERLAQMRAEAEAKAGPDYRVHTWVSPTPERWLDGVAAINARMATDLPAGGLELDQEVWDAERVRHEEERSASVGRIRLVAVAEHVPSGKLVGLNGLSMSADVTRPVHQGLTLVLTEHRGHRLGMLLKLANMAQLAEVRPEAPFILTGNAEENRPMLDVNEAVGFVPVVYVGAWKKTLTETP
jgi:GNAT superfamily N-acetyltransferase